VLDYNLPFLLFGFVAGGDSVCPGAVLDYVPEGVGKGVTCDVCCSPVHSAGLHKQLWNWLVGRNGVPLFSVWQGVGRLSMG
jgi:hypothetical protein